MDYNFETLTTQAYHKAEQKAKDRKSLYKTLAVYAAIFVISKKVGNIIAPKSNKPYRSTY